MANNKAPKSLLPSPTPNKRGDDYSNKTKTDIFTSNINSNLFCLHSVTKEEGSKYLLPQLNNNMNETFTKSLKRNTFNLSHVAINIEPISFILILTSTQLGGNHNNKI